MRSEETVWDRATNRRLTSFGGVEQRLQIVQPRQTAKINKRIALFPIIFFQVYLAVSVLTFAFGPWPWPVSNPFQLYSFLILAQVALLAGYLQAIKKQPRPASTKLRVPLMVTVSLVFNYLWLPEIYEIRTGQAFNLGAAISAMMTGLTDPGHEYLENKKYTALQGVNMAGHTTAIVYATFLVYPIMWIAFPLGVVFWKQLKVPVRVALVGFITLDLSVWVATGTNKGIADFVLLLPCLLVARQPAILMKIRLQNVLKIGMVAMLGLVALFTFFSMGMVGRTNGLTVSHSDAAAGIAPEFDGPILSIVPPALQEDLASLASYYIQGYYALSLSLKEPFIFCYGVGNSYFLEGLSRHLVNTPISNDTYPARIQENGWNAYGRWHSIYPWIASDLSFPGTIVFMFLLGRVFALVWIDVAFCGNPWAVCLLPLLLTMLFYVPANNQVLGFPQAAMSFWALLLLWSLSRARGGANRRAIVTS
jgi:hypothetical protein